MKWAAISRFFRRSRCLGWGLDVALITVRSSEFSVGMAPMILHAANSAKNNATESVDTETHDVSGPPAMMQERAGGARGLDDKPETAA